MENLMLKSILKENLLDYRYTFLNIIIIMDLLLCFILYNQKLNNFDKYNIISILISHVVFIFALIQENLLVLDNFMCFCKK